MRRGSVVIAALAGLMLAAAGAPAPAGVSSQSAFDRLKGLSGTWTGSIEGAAATGEQPAKVVYRNTAAGTAVMETLFPGTDHEMVSVYYLDGSELKMTHYCAAGNQPRMRLDTKTSSADELVFAFDGGSNLDPRKDMHIHSGRITLLANGDMQASWSYYQNGKESGEHKIRFTDRVE